MKTEEIMMEMRDGVRLQSFIHLPPGNGPFPALLARCMYGADRMRDNAEFYRAKGYAVVLQNVRGRHGSEGGAIGRNDFPEDGYDTMAWMATQPWCNQRIGTIGRSALARFQIATAFLGHPAHLAMVAGSSSLRDDEPLGRGFYVQPASPVALLCAERP